MPRCHQLGADSDGRKKRKKENPGGSKGGGAPFEKKTITMIANTVLIGQYAASGSVLERLDARLKIISLAAFAVMLFTASTARTMLLMLIYTSLLIALSRVGIRPLLRGLRPVAFLAAFALIFGAFSRAGTEIFSFGALICTREGLFYGAFAALRLMLLALSSCILTASTKPLDLTSAVESLLSPLAVFKLPVRDIAAMTGIAIRFIPTLAEEARAIADAQKSRGADFDGRGIIKKARAALPLVVPLLAGAFRHSDALADAMDARCYGFCRRTRMSAHTFQKTDAAAAVIVIFAAAAFAGVELL